MKSDIGCLPWHTLNSNEEKLCEDAPQDAQGKQLTAKWPIQTNDKITAKNSKL